MALMADIKGKSKAEITEETMEAISEMDQVQMS